MATTITPLPGPFRSPLAEESSLGATVVKDILQGPGKLRAVTIKNTSAQMVHYKVFNDKSPTLGTTNPDLILPCAASDEVTYTIDVRDSDTDTVSEGLNFSVAYSHACVQEGGTSGTTAPSATVTISLDFDPL